MRISYWSSDVCSSDLAGYRKTVEFVVTPAFAYTTNAKYADLVLPVTTPWERVGYFSDKYARECLFVTANVIPPLYESQSDQWIAKEIGRRIGLDVDQIFPISEKQQFFNEQIGRASCRERVCRYV